MEVLLDQAEGALVRLLGTVERRGFTLAGMSADSTEAGTRVRLQLDGARDLLVLCRQIERLIDVREVRLLPAAAEHLPAENFHATWLQ